MDKPAVPKNRLNIHWCPIHQIDIPPAQISSYKSTISSKALAEMVLFSNNSIWDMSCFLRASVLLSKEQSGTVDMANKYKLFSLSILIIQRGRKRLTPLRWFTASWRQSIYEHDLQREPKLDYASTSHGGKASFCIMGWLLFCRTKPKGGICLHVKWADTDFYLCRIVMCSNGYVCKLW